MAILARFMKIAALATAALLGACGGGGGGSSGGGGGGGGGIVDAGILKLALTDAPACNFETVNVTVQKVRVHQSSTAAAGDAGWSEIVLSPGPQRIDLLSLMNGVVLELGQQTVPVGTYRQLSLVLASNDATTPLANAVDPVGATPERALGSPANLQAALTIPVSITVVKDQVSDYVIDFDACNSVVGPDATGNYDLSPSLSVVQRLSATGQRVTGYVDVGGANPATPATTRVYLESNGTIVRGTNPDANGRFVLYPAPVGTYDVVISALGSVPAVITGVPVSVSASTDINTAATPIQLPASASHTISVTVNATPAVDARVTIVKRYTGGPDATIAGAPARANSGAQLYTVSTGAAIRAPYVANVQPVFTPDNNPPTGRYTVTATAGGVTKTADVDATTSDPSVSFTIP